MKIGVLTSSRADFGIYKNLIRGMTKDDFFQIELIVFGMHMLAAQGNTKDEIISEFPDLKKHYLAIRINDTEKNSVTMEFAQTILNFNKFWALNKYDWIFCLGDRFEMCAAVQAGIFFNNKFAHIHGGEITEGAIDNIFRDQISLASSVHFVSNRVYKKRLMSLLQFNKNVFITGSISLNKSNYDIKTTDDFFYGKLNLKRDCPFILFTYHPETISDFSLEKVAKFLKDCINLMKDKWQLLITASNIDEGGEIFNNLWYECRHENEQIVFHNSLGKELYFEAMARASFMVGNTSSGIIEAASFGKFVINIGDRQKGRARSNNIIDVGYNIEEFKIGLKKVDQKYIGKNIYYKSGSVELVLKEMKKIGGFNQVK